MTFRGSAWQQVNDQSKQRYIENAYRVLLTRARQGMVIFVPAGDDQDQTRLASWYDEIAKFLGGCGIQRVYP